MLRYIETLLSEYTINESNSYAMRFLFALRKALGLVLSANRWGSNALDAYVTSVPSAQNAVDIFRGCWSSRFPRPFDHLRAGASPLFDDERITWLIDQLGGLDGYSVLELGPLEGGHSYMMEKSGAASIVAIEANTQAFLKCLTTKELLELRRTKFVCGDFTEFLKSQDGPRKFDLCVASGVLYHMQNPVELIAQLAERCSRHLFLWTHYYDAAAIGKSARLGSKFGAGKPASFGGFSHKLYGQEYGATLYRPGFCGGTARTSNWMAQDEILAALSFFGFTELRVEFDRPDHPNGPSFAVLASR